MGEGDKRQSARVVRDTSRPADATADQPIPKDAAAALLSRTATLDDPLTTMLLAEASRRSMTIEISPDEVAHIVDKPIDHDDPPDDWDD